MSEEIKIPAGFQFAGIHCGIKKDALDLALVVADQPAVCAGVYTQNLVRAASIDWNRSITPSDKVRAIVINSGNANACTGETGVQNNLALAELIANQLKCEPSQIPVLSTGVIGHQLPMERISAPLSTCCEALGTTTDDFANASIAITTTDNAPKTVGRTFEIGDKVISITGMAKGAGMIGPKMATMLSVITTDAEIDSATADLLLRTAVDRTFNSISVDGHTSTNDAVLLLCSGRAGQLSGDGMEAFGAHLLAVCEELAKKIPSDGEGATHLIEILVRGANDQADADQIARTIAASNLVKTAITGADPNWGRIVSAAGYAGVEIDPTEISLELNGHSVYKLGTPVTFDEQTVSQSMKDNFQTDVVLTVGTGTGAAKHWTSDLTCDYVKLNSEYTT